MAQAAPRLLYGIDTIVPYRRSDGLPYGSLRVLGGFTGGIAGDLNMLHGGSAKWPWAVEGGKLTGELSMTVKEFHNMNWELFMGKAPTDTAAESAGSVTTLTDKKGTVVDGTTGVASVGLKSGSSADLKFAQYVVKTVSSTTVDVFIRSTIDRGRGTDLTIVDDDLKITASALTVPGTSGVVEIPNTGLELIGGSGTVDLVALGAAGDTATFSSRPPNSKSMDVTIGSTTDTFPAFGCLAYGKQLSEAGGEMVELDFFNVRGIGWPITLAEDAWAEAEIKMQAFYDATLDAVYSVRHVSPTE